MVVRGIFSPKNTGMTATALKLYSTTIGKKAVMSLTGALMVLFVVIHLAGNLQVFAGAEKMNAYAAFLKRLGGLLWAFRVVMLLAILLHVFTALQLIVRSLRSRPKGYAMKRHVEASISSRTMIWTGPLMGAYIVYHLLHQTLGTILPGFDPANVQNNVIIGLSSVPASVTYIAAMLVLGLHLKHGIWSMFQTLGLNGPGSDRLLRILSVAIAVIVAAGFISIPVSVLVTGWIS